MKKLPLIDELRQNNPEVQEKTLSGTIERVTFHNEENGYCVLRVRANGATKVLTVVGNCAAPNAGEAVSYTHLTLPTILLV